MHELPSFISSKVSKLPPALSVYVNQLVYELKRKGRDIITLSLGEAFFDIPKFEFNPLDWHQGHHYTDSQGIPVLREKIASYYREKYQASIQASNVLISAGSKIITFMCMQALLDIGEEVLIHEPAWLSYKEQAALLGAEVRFIPFSVKCSDFSQYFNVKTKILILNNPNNPSGFLYSKEQLLALYDACRQHKIYLIIDEAYSDFAPANEFHSMAKLALGLEGVIVVNSLSKNMGISGWRIGYTIAEPAILNVLLKLNQHLITCAPTVLQQYVAEHFDDILSHTLPQVRNLVLKRERIKKNLDKLQLDYLPGSATFYFFVSTGQYLGDVHDLALYLLLEKGVAVVPGSAYGEHTNHFLRVSIGAESDERIESALATLKNALSSMPINGQYVHDEIRKLGLPAFSEAYASNAKPREVFV